MEKIILIKKKQSKLQVKKVYYKYKINEAGTDIGRLYSFLKN